MKLTRGDVAALVLCWINWKETMMKIEFTERDEEYLAELRARGCAVTVFLPHELGAVDPEVVEERMCMAGWDAIDMLKEGTDEADEE